MLHKLITAIFMIGVLSGCADLRGEYNGGNTCVVNMPNDCAFSAVSSYSSTNCSEVMTRCP